MDGYLVFDMESVAELAPPGKSGEKIADYVAHAEAHEKRNAKAQEGEDRQRLITRNALHGRKNDYTQNNAHNHAHHDVENASEPTRPFKDHHILLYCSRFWLEASMSSLCSAQAFSTWTLGRGVSDYPSLRTRGPPNGLPAMPLAISRPCEIAMTGRKSVVAPTGFARARMA